ncbi:MAG: DUF3108 domain-containing protein [Pseudomonadota bacterium]
MIPSHKTARKPLHSAASSAVLGLGLGLGLCALLASLTIASAEDATTETTPRTNTAQDIYAFQVGWGNLAIGEGAFTVMDDPDGAYQIITGGRSVGPLARWAPWRGSLVSIGRRQGLERLPIEYKSTSITKRGPIRAQVLWLEEGAPITAVSPRPDPEKVTPIEPDEIQDVSDSLSFYASLVDTVRHSDGDACDVETKVWDGYRLYSLKSEAGGPGEAEKDRPWAYGGPTMTCKLLFSRIGGFPKERGWGAPEGDTPRTIHFAEVAGEWAPVRVEIPSPIGTVVVRVRFTESQLAWTDD